MGYYHSKEYKLGQLLYEKIQNYSIAELESFLSRSNVNLTIEESEVIVDKVLSLGGKNTELIENAILIFTKAYLPKRQYFWVHSFSHFSESLWKMKLQDEIKKLNKIAFDGAVKTGEFSCLNRLLEDFLKYAKWNDNPCDFHLAIQESPSKVLIEKLQKIRKFPFPSINRWKKWKSKETN